MGRRLIAALARLDDHWLGDVLGVICLAAIVPMVLFAGLILGGEP